jgi:hypothetical protein
MLKEEFKLRECVPGKNFLRFDKNRMDENPI